MVWWIHALHVVAMAVIVGGSAAHAVGTVRDARRFELGFWGSAGLIVATGVGNIGSRGGTAALDGSWGLLLGIKLVLVLALLTLSVRRSVLVWRAHAGPGWYVATAAIAGVVAVMGVWLAHAPG